MAAPAVAPVLSTPDTHIFEDPTEPVAPAPRVAPAQLAETYEIERTVREIRAGRWRRVALQFPDHMLVDAPRVYEALRRGLSAARKGGADGVEDVAKGLEEVGLDAAKEKEKEEEPEEQLYILGDTSYGACCVDEIAAEHVDADVVVHYGRSCLSPTARLPVIYVFTTMPLELEPVVEVFKQTYPEKGQKIVLMADIPYAGHLPALHDLLQQEGYTGLYLTSILHNPSSPLPNRTVPDEVQENMAALRDYELFHVSDPPTSLLLTLSSRVGNINIYPTDTVKPTQTLLASSARTLRRRYALLTKLTTVPVFGILINTLSVANYMHVLSHVKEQIEAAGKKSYTFVVGKVNAAKVANFSEVEGWVVIGCWESSLIESKDFWRPIITPFELSLALKSDEERVWTGEWTGDFEAVLKERVQRRAEAEAEAEAEQGEEAGESEEESAPPEFDLRTGRYVSHARPLRAGPKTASVEGSLSSKSLVKRANGDIAQIGGVVSPGAEYLRSKRTWQGLGSDFEGGEGPERGAAMEEGRSGIARGYVVGARGAEVR